MIVGRRTAVLFLVVLLLLTPVVAYAVDVGSYTALKQAAADNETDVNIVADIIYDPAATTVSFNNDVAINGNNHTLTGNGNVRLITVNADLTMSNLTLTDGHAGADRGGAVYVTGSATVTDCTFDDNHAMTGGALAVDGGLVLDSSVFTDNTATTGGGAVSRGNIGYLATITDCSFINNRAGWFGGSAVQLADDAYVSGSSFIDNACIVQQSLFQGAGAALEAGPTSQITLNDCTFINNSSTAGDALVDASKLTGAVASGFLFPFAGTNGTVIVDQGSVFRGNTPHTVYDVPNGYRDIETPLPPALPPTQVIAGNGSGPDRAAQGVLRSLVHVPLRITAYGAFAERTQLIGVSLVAGEAFDALTAAAQREFGAAPALVFELSLSQPGEVSELAIATDLPAGTLVHVLCLEGGNVRSLAAAVADGRVAVEVTALGAYALVAE